MRSHLLALALCLCHASVTVAQVAVPAVSSTPLTYPAAVQQALAANPSILAARLKRAVSIASRDVVAERLNPEFRAEWAKETPKDAYTVAWPWDGKRGRRVAVGEAAVLTGEAELNATIAQVQADVRKTFVTRFLAEARQALLGEMQGLAQRARDAAQARVDAGDAPRLELLQAELAYADAQNQSAAAAGVVTGARAALNALLGWPLTDATPIDVGIADEPLLGMDTALARARQANAELALFDRRIEEQRTRVELAHAMRQPDVRPEATFTRRAEPEFMYGWRAAVAITLPIFTTHTAGVVMEQATLTQLAAEREAALARISGDVAAAVAIAEAQRQQYVRYRDQVLPQALEVERMAEDSYRLGQTNIAAYLQALQSAADLQAALADLDRAIGAPPPAATRPPTP